MVRDITRREGDSTGRPGVVCIAVWEASAEFCAAVFADVEVNGLTMRTPTKIVVLSVSAVLEPEDVFDDLK
jgi:hypothetical protein